MADPDHPSDAFFLIVADLDTGMFCVEGPMSDDAPWCVAAGRARERHDRHVLCGPTGPDRDALATNSSAHMVGSPAFHQAAS